MLIIQFSLTNLTSVIYQFDPRGKFNNNGVFRRLPYSWSLIHHSSFRVGPLISLFAMAIACGNIKPCLAAFGGDQFRKDQVSPVLNQHKEIDIFFCSF